MLSSANAFNLDNTRILSSATCLKISLRLPTWSEYITEERLNLFVIATVA